VAPGPDSAGTAVPFPKASTHRRASRLATLCALALGGLGLACALTATSGSLASPFCPSTSPWPWVPPSYATTCRVLALQIRTTNVPKMSYFRSADT